MFDIRSLTWDEWSYPELLFTLRTNLAEDSGAVQKASINLHRDDLDISGGISSRHAQNPLSVSERKHSQ